MENDLPVAELVAILVIVAIALGGLVMASFGGTLYGLGLAIFAVAVVLGFWTIKRHYDRVDASGRH